MYSLIIIDDEEKIASGIGALFPWEDIGFHVSGTFTRACDALEFIKENQVDVVLTDVEMPDINGIDLAQRFKGDEKVQVVLFSSYDTYEYLRAAIKNEVVDFLLKPIKYSQLLECFDGVREKLRHKGVPGMSGGGTQRRPSDRKNQGISGYSLSTRDLRGCGRACEYEPVLSVPLF